MCVDYFVMVDNTQACNRMVWPSCWSIVKGTTREGHLSLCCDSKVPLLHGCVGNDDEQRKAPAPGDPDFRWHASIPERATLDYIK